MLMANARLFYVVLCDSGSILRIMVRPTALANVLLTLLLLLLLDKKVAFNNLAPSANDVSMVPLTSVEFVTKLVLVICNGAKMLLCIQLYSTTTYYYLLYLITLTTYIDFVSSDDDSIFVKMHANSAVFTNDGR